MLKEEVVETLQRNHQELTKYGIKSIGIFGSVARGEETKNSDIDILVDFDKSKDLFLFMDIQDYLENILHRKVDLVTRNALHPKLSSTILSETVYVF